MLYLDTSLVVSSVSVEVRTDDVIRWMEQQDQDEFAISDWVVTEFSSAASLKLRTGVIDSARRTAMLAQFAKLSVHTFHVLPVEASAFRTAARFCDQPQLNLRSGDALHLAVCAENGATMCTLDQKLNQAATLVGIPSVLL